MLLIYGRRFCRTVFEYRVLYIEDGEYRVKHRFSEGLYIENNYVLNIEREWYREYVFTFTDDFFKSDKPVDAPLRWAYILFTVLQRVALERITVQHQTNSDL